MIHFAVSLNAPTSNAPPLHVFTAFNGMNEGCIYCIDPPDVQLAVGPSQIIELVNLAYQVYSKDGTALTSVNSLPGFFKTNFQTSGDPKVLFDSLSGRFFASLMDNSANFVEIAVSDTNNATGTWHFYKINAVCPPGHGCNVDQPIIGVSNDKFVVSVNEADSTTHVCFCAEYFVMNKRQMTENATTPATQEFGPDSSTLSIHPAQSLSSSDDLFMVAAGETPTETTTNIAKLYHVTGLPPNAGVTTSTFTLAAVTNPVSAVEPNGGTVWGNCGSFNCADARVQSAVLFNGKLWFAFMEEVSGTDAIRLAEIDTQAGTLVQSFDFVRSNQQNYFEYLYYPALTMDAMGNMALVYGFSDQIDYPSIAVDEQAVTDGINTMELPQTILSSTVDAGSGRYGDYFGAAVDPANTAEVWVAGEYNFPSSSCLPSCWGTEVAGMQTTDFAASSSPSSLSIVAGSTASSTITLSSVNSFSAPGDLAPQASVSISATSIDDNFCRSIGLLFDQTLYSDFWNSQPSSVISPPGGACGSFPYSNTYALGSGSHFLEFGVSAFVGQWRAQISVNGVQMVTVDTDVNHHVHVTFQVGGVSVSGGGANPPTASMNPTSITPPAGGSATSTLTVSTTSSTTAGTYTITVTAGSAGLTHSTTVTVTVTSFIVSTSPSSASLVLAGSSTTSTITVTSLNGFSGAVILAASSSPSGPVVSVWPYNVSIASGGSATSTLDISAGGATPGSYTVTVIGTSGSDTQSGTVALSVSGDFGISASPASLSIRGGKSGTSTLTLSSANGLGLAGTITLTNQTSVSISATSTDDTFCRSFGLLFDQTLNPDFWNSQPSSVIGTGCSPFNYSHTYSLSTGSHFVEFGVSAFVGHWHVQITLNGVTVASVDTDVNHHVHVPFRAAGVAISPIVSSGPTVSLSATSKTISSGGTATVTLTVDTTRSTPTGTYTVTVTATSGGLSHALTITVTIN